MTDLSAILEPIISIIIIIIIIIINIIIIICTIIYLTMSLWYVCPINTESRRRLTFNKVNR